MSLGAAESHACHPLDRFRDAANFGDRLMLADFDRDVVAIANQPLGIEMTRANLAESSTRPLARRSATDAEGAPVTSISNGSVRVPNAH